MIYKYSRLPQIRYQFQEKGLKIKIVSQFTTCVENKKDKTGLAHIKVSQEILSVLILHAEIDTNVE